jgi:hypothetical protein
MKVSRVAAHRAPIILIHGDPGRGKTTLALKAPKPVAILAERGMPVGVSVDAIDGGDSYRGIISALRELFNDPAGYESLIIETLDKVEVLLTHDLCERNHWKNIEQPSFGKGYVAAEQEWQRHLLRGLMAIRDRHNMLIVMTCHTSVERIDDPRAPSYTSYQPRLHRRVRGPVMDACDAVFFLAEDLNVVTDGEGFRERVRAAASPQRFLFTEGRPAFAAKNRFGMPAKIPIPLDFDFANLARYWANPEQS